MTYYVLYDSNSLVPQSVSGSPHEHLPQNLLEAQISDQDGEDFVLFRRDMNHYVVNVVDGFAEFLNRWNRAAYKKYLVPDNVVRDLDYNIVFILNFEIKFEYNSGQLTLTLDLPALSSDRRNMFNTAITDTNGLCTMYVTRYQDPTVLLEKFEVDLFQLSKVRTYTVDLAVDQKITVWATRKKQ